MSAQHIQTLAQQFRAAALNNQKFTFPLMTAAQWSQLDALLAD